MNSQERILHIVERLTQKEWCTKDLARDLLGQDDESYRRLIQNDIKIIRKLFGEKCISTKRGCYKFINLPQTMQNLYENSAQDMSDLFEFIALFDAKMLRMFEESEPALVKRLKKQMRVIYQLHSSPFEEIKDQKIWHTLKGAIRDKRYICIAYHKNRLISYDHVKPIKIVFAKNNWYLATIISEEDKHGYGFTFLRINHIIGLSMEAQNFQEDISALKFLENFQTLFEVYGGKSYIVKLLAKKEIAVFFKQKKYLKSQIITKTQEDGSLMLSYRINNTFEIMPLIKQWLPHLTVVEPQTLKEEIDNTLHQYLDN